jgi:hypothetical protein
MSQALTLILLVVGRLGSFAAIGVKRLPDVERLRGGVKRFLLSGSAAKGVFRRASTFCLVNSHPLSNTKRWRDAPGHVAEA